MKEHKVQWFGGSARARSRAYSRLLDSLEKGQLPLKLYNKQDQIGYVLYKCSDCDGFRGEPFAHHAECSAFEPQRDLARFM